jgi:dihydrofolate reductase
MLSMIVAHDLARNIGFQNDMPWGRDMKADLSRFKHLTDGKMIIMGRKTFQSLPGILPYRSHVVLTKQDFTVKSPFVSTYNDIDTVLKMVEFEAKDDEAFVIGGASIYEQFMPYVDRIYVTKIHELFEGDTKFPSIEGKWNITYGPKVHIEGDKYPTEYITYTRRA